MRPARQFTALDLVSGILTLFRPLQSLLHLYDRIRFALPRWHGTRLTQQGLDYTAVTQGVLFKRFGQGAGAAYGCLLIIVLLVLVVALPAGWLKFPNI
jgi:hypothetical protein